MNAIRTHKDIAARGCAMGAMAVEEIGSDAALVLGEATEPMAAKNARLANAGAHGIMNDALQAAAMNGELRILIARVEPAGLPPDLLPEAVGVNELVCADTRRIESVKQAKLRQFLDGVGERVDANPELANCLRL